MAATTPVASVIIPVYNAEATLRACLDAVFANRGVAFEVVIVDDASTDRSLSIALEYPCRVLAVAANVMAANCRNLGAHHAAGEILIFVDSDEVMPSDTLERFLEALRQRPDIAAVVGSYQADTPMPGFFSKFKNLQHHYTHQTAHPEGATLHSGLTAIRKGVFDACGGFEPAFGPASIEDIALGYEMRRRGFRILFRPEIQLAHWKGYTFWGLLRSDLVHRAIPWTALMLRDRVYRRDLNTGASNVASVALAWLLPVFFLLPPVAGAPGWGAAVALAAVALAAIWSLNAGLLAACRREHGWGFVAKSLLFLPAMYFYHGVGLLAGLVYYGLGRSVVRGRAAPSPAFRVLVGGGGTVTAAPDAAPGQVAGRARVP